MKFIFPDSQDFVDPSFDFHTERRGEGRLRARDDKYAHEVFAHPPFDGLLVSKAIVEGVAESAKAAKYGLAQRHRLLRVGVRDFFRLDDQESSRRLITMGDCGAFSYVKEEVPPFTVDEVLDFYEACGFDIGVSVDHVILGFDATLDDVFPGMDVVAKEYRRRQEITLALARDFIRQHRARRCQFQPMGVAQGWSPRSYAKAVKQLQKMGYTRIALGGMVPLKTPEILATLKGVSEVREASTQLHLLGVTRTDAVEDFERYGVTSFDTTSPFLRAFKDAKHNYYTSNDAYTAIRIPQVDGNASLGRLIRAGQVNQKEARRLEGACLARLRKLGEGKATVEEVMDPLMEYDELVGAGREGEGNRIAAYRKTLTDRPWEACRCEVCRAIGVEVIIFRGSERNKRRGFHNLHVLYGRLHHELGRLRTGRGGRSATKRSGVALRTMQPSSATAKRNIK